MATKKEQRAQEKAEAIERVREYLARAATVRQYDQKTKEYRQVPRVRCILRSVSRSGMNRRITLFTVDKRDGSLDYLDGTVAEVLGIHLRQGLEGIPVSGCGMDMGFKLVYDLASVVYGDGYALQSEWI